MGLLDEAKKKLGSAVDKHGDKISAGLDKAGNAVDVKTGGKHRANIKTGVAKAKGALEDLDGKRDDFSPTAGRDDEKTQPPDPKPDEPGGPSKDAPGPSGPSDPAKPTEPTQPAAPSGPMPGAGDSNQGDSNQGGEGDSDPVPTDPHPVPPEPGADPNESSEVRLSSVGSAR